MSTAVFKKWTAAVSCLNEKIKNSRLIAGRNIQLENTGHGIRIHASAANNPKACTYGGYFQAIQTADNKIKIIDGFDPESGYAGDALINDTMFTDIPAREFTITANSFVYLITESGTSDYESTLQIFNSKQSYELEKSKILVSRVKFSDSKISKFSQEVHGMPTGFIDGDCG